MSLPTNWAAVKVSGVFLVTVNGPSLTAVGDRLTGAACDVTTAVFTKVVARVAVVTTAVVGGWTTAGWTAAGCTDLTAAGCANAAAGATTAG